ncbi:MAG TPA: AsmA-like C-terminal domain-containing protein [Alphaproteobacteria bacterium]|nr:AsmA-like C-terminal domain-containing protein [Alphaproteobacteria bacterium]
MASRRRSRLRRLAAAVVVVVGLLVLGTGLLTWRLSQGPLPLDFLTRRIERALSDAEARVVIKDTVLVWAGWRENFEIRVRGVRMLLPDGRATLELPEMGIELSLHALLAHRLVAPASLEAIGARLVVVRAADGTWRFRSAGGGDAPSAVPFVLDDLLAPPDPTTSLGYLESASVVDSTVTIIDEGSGRSFVAHNAHLEVERGDDGLRAQLSAILDVADGSATLSATGHYAASSKTLGLAVGFAKVDPASVAAVAPELRAMAGVAVPLSGRVDLAFDPQFRLTQAGFDFTGETGKITAASSGLPEDAPVRHLRLQGRLSGDLGDIEISNAEIDLGGPVVNLRGRMTGADARPRAAGTVLVRNVTADDVRRLWPKDLAPQAREWVSENEIGGNLSELSADIAAQAASPAGPWAVERVQGAFRVAGAEVNYLSPLPHISDVSLAGKFTSDRVDIAVASGHVGDLQVADGSVALTGLATDDPAAELDLPVSGPLRQALNLIDSPPLGELKKAGLNPADFSGDMTLRLAVKLPLAQELSADRLDVRVTGRLRRLAMRGAAFGQDIADGDVEIAVDRAGLDISGRTRIGAIPADIEFHRGFAADAAVVTRAKVQARIASAADAAAFGVDVSPYVDGPTALAVDYVERRGGRGEVTVDAKLDDAAVSVAPLGWHKPAGQPAAAHATAKLGGGQAMEIPEFSFASGNPAQGGLDVRGRATLSADGSSLTKLDVTTLKVGLTDLHGTLSRSESGLSIGLAGPSLDIAPLQQGDAGSASTAGGAPLKVDLHLDRLYSGPDRWLAKFRFAGQRGAARWESADLAAETTDEAKRPGQAKVKLHTRADGRQTLDVAIDDAGAFLDDLGLTSNIHGGRLELHGATDTARAERPLAGHVHMAEYRLVRAPILARVLTVALVTGILDSLSGPGIRFAQLDSDFAYFGSRIDIEDAHTAGASLGISAAGTIDIDASALDLKGTIVPAYALNSLPGRIPLIGQLLTAGSRGMFATNYAVRGPVSSPQIAVNAASTLAPSFLRHLFGAGGSSASTGSSR